MVLGGCCLGIIAIFLPPLVVFIRRGCGADLLINIGLLFLAWIPGVLHAWYIILEYPSFRQRQKIKRERAQSYSSSRGARSPARRSQEVGYERRRSTSRNPYGATTRPYYRDEYYDGGRQPAAYYPPPPRYKY
ncbi:hypothetical protein M409DRAFT_30863 [Zasmidium cellare ATCC 36951]|uniref:Stress response RCI peptide n=1 Tax=Zasmidium cellare ATCC 36951 TaxID=1080233 RepID=A0A6A6BX77_ZASCE|nr:uncharacterized protein M409DRAFT_30863 [Zasmidium cellare ATCC 36951]KAF2158638.1 hypothetical protein M409DRAFT_30863 [Zasmidium cellare ATCC 36951]